MLDKSAFKVINLTISLQMHSHPIANGGWGI